MTLNILYTCRSWRLYFRVPPRSSRKTGRTCGGVGQVPLPLRRLAHIWCGVHHRGPAGRHYLRGEDGRAGQSGGGGCGAHR